jgi:F-type H+-transporting ATPase subunit b
MELVKPAVGLIFWMLVSFGIIFFILKKFAWKPILKALNDRETSIQNTIDEAKKAREEMASLKAGNEKILQEAKAERDKLLKEARETKDAIIAEAKQKAQKEGERMIEQARETIQNEKMAAITELKNQVATLSIEIAEKILKEELSSTEKQKQLVKSLLEDVNLN